MMQDDDENDVNGTVGVNHHEMTNKENDINDEAHPLHAAQDQDRSTTSDDDNNIAILQSVLPTLIISILLGLVSGTLYGFGRYSKTLKGLLGLSQSQVQTLGICMDCGNYVGHPLTGLIYDRKGPIVSCLVGSVIVFAGYWRIRWTLLNHDVDDDLSTTASILLDLAFCGVGFGSGLGYISGLGTTTKILSKPSTIQYLGTGIGMVAAGYGMSSTLVGLTYQHLPDLASFFLFWALFVPAVNVFAALMLRMQAKTASADSMFDTQSDASSIPSTDPEEEPLLPFPTEDLLLEEPSEKVAGPWNSWKSPEFWLLFCSFSCVSGCGLMVINNVSTMVESMGGTDAYAGTLILVLSISNVSGRIVTGILGDSSAISILPESVAVRRIRLLQGVNLIMFFAMLMGYLGGQRSVCLTVLVILVALAYGGSWVLIVALASNLFGKDHFGKDYGLLALGPALSGMVFNKASALWYELHASSSTNICMGRECYETSYLVAGLVAMAGNLVTVILYEIVCEKENSTDRENDKMVTAECCTV